MNKIDQGRRHGVGACYTIFKGYLRFLHDKLYYRRTYVINREAVPEAGTPLMIVSNHQNCLNDAFGILFNINDRKTRFITRGDVFALSPLAAKFLYSIGLLPSFRLEHEGAEKVEKNKDVFRVSEQALIDGNTIMMFPEAGHQDKRWLGKFTYGYTRLAFEAAEMGGFEKDVLILPSCNHYSDYFGIRNDFMVKFGTPISLKPYYELYKTRPRTAQREVNRLVREQIQGMMLDIRDLEHYNEIDFLRNTYGIDYACARGFNPDILPQKLESDKELVALIDSASDERKEKLFQDTAELMKGIRETGIADRNLEKEPGTAVTFLKCIGMALLLPVWIVNLWPALPTYLIAIALSKKMKDRMFEGTFLFAISALFTIPVFSIADFMIVCSIANWWVALIYVVVSLLLAIAAWKYAMKLRDLFQDIRYCMKRNGSGMSALKRLREKIHSELNAIVLNQ